MNNFSGKYDVISLKNSAFRELQDLLKFIFRYNFQFSAFILKGSSKRCLIFFLLLKSVAPRVTVQSHSKRMFDS